MTLAGTALIIATEHTSAQSCEALAAAQRNAEDARWAIVVVVGVAIVLLLVLTDWEHVGMRIRRAARRARR